jgi:hypothetical protein
MTQTSSKPRVKNDTVGDNGLKQLYTAYESMTKEEFRSFCKELIESSTGKRATKDSFIVALDRAPSKDRMVQSVTNYLLAGQGLGV